MSAESKDSQSSGSPSPLAFGRGLLTEFLIDPTYRNLNHGSFGTIPRPVQAQLRNFQDQAEARPDPFLRYTSPKLLDESRAALAKYLSCPVSAVVLVSNATTGVNTVLRALSWDDDGGDVILYFSTVYGGCGRTIDYVVDSSRGLASSHEIEIKYPIEDDEIVLRFRKAVAALKEEGKRPKICMFDAVSSLPGVRFPFERMTAACREEGVLSLIDGAQGVGMISLDLGALDPDFFVSNCHKWMHVPRGCAVFYVPERNQHLIPSTLPTSHGYIAPAGSPSLKRGQRSNPLPPSGKSTFVRNFEFVGTVDSSPYYCIPSAIRWREEVLGGEDRILAYLHKLAKDGGRIVAEALDTRVLENAAGTLTNCSMVNVALPLVVEGASHPPEQRHTNDATIPQPVAYEMTQWILETLMEEYHTFVAIYLYDGRLWVRISAQVYLDESDFEWAGKTLLEVCLKAAAKFGTAKLL